MPEEAKKGKANEAKGFAIPGATLLLRPEKERTTAARNGVTEDRLRAVMQEQTKKLNDAQGIMEVLPDLQLVRSIRVAGVLSPKDLTPPKLRLRVNGDVFDKPVKQTIITKLVSHFCNTYPLEKKLSTIVEKGLFTEGAYIQIMLPPNQIDGIVSGRVPLESVSMEHLNKEEKFDTPHGILAIPAGLDDPLLSYTDNLNFLRKAEFNSTVRRGNAWEIAMESALQPLGEYDKTIPRAKVMPFQRIRKMERDKRVGANPILFNCPVDACLPVCEPSNPEEHLGYYFLYGKEGYLVSGVEDSDFMTTLGQRLRETLEKKKESGSLNRITSNAIKYMDDNAIKKDQETLYNAHITVLEEELLSLVKNGELGQDVTVPRHEQFYRLFLARYLSGKATRVVYVPAEFVSYIAFDYNSLGIGRSILEKTKMFSSMRAVIMFAEYCAGLFNSIPRTQMQVTLDEQDRDPTKTIETLMHEYARLMNLNFPIGTINPSDIINSIRKASMQLKIDGGERFPRTGAEIEDRQRQMAKPDETLRDEFKKLHYASCGVPPEMIDVTLQGEFAAGTINNQMMFAKTSMEDQDTLITQVNVLMRRYILLSEELTGVILKEMNWSEEKEEDMDQFLSFLAALEMELPKADFAKIDAQSDALEAQERLADMAVNQIISEDMGRGLLKGQFTTEALAGVRAMFKAQYLRNWMKRENIAPELVALAETEEGVDDNPLVKDIQKHIETLVKNCGELIRRAMEVESKEDKDTTKVSEKTLGGGGTEEPTAAPGVSETGEFQPFGEGATPEGEATPPDENAPPADETAAPPEEPVPAEEEPPVV